MPAERAGYTVFMFLIDVSPSMGGIRTVEVETSTGQTQTVEMTHLEFGLQFVKLKIQEMIFNGRKTDRCGVIVFGSEDTRNVVNDENGAYENVTEYIPIAQPNAATIAKIDALAPSTVFGDPIDALIVGVETQSKYLVSKKSWTRRITLITDGESPIEVEDWELTVTKMDLLQIHLTVIGIDFDDEELPYMEPNKSNIKRTNEEFFKKLTSSMASATLGTCEHALQQAVRPDIKTVRSTLMATTLRLGNTADDGRSAEALEFSVKMSKCTSVARPKGWTKYTLRAYETSPDEMVVDSDESIYAPLKLRSEYYVDRNAANKNGEDEDGDADIKKEDDDVLLLDGISEDPKRKKIDTSEKIEKEELVRGFKYGTTYAPCPDGQFPKLTTHKGIDICGFFPRANFRRELSMGEIQYIWADPSSAQQQVALSSFVQAMEKKKVLAIARWVSRDGMDPKMGVLLPVAGDNVHYLLWGQMPFADDVRKYTFASLDTLINKKGEILTEHPYLPTSKQLDAMDDFVDSMDLMHAGPKDDNGYCGPWFETSLSYNPAIHRVKQAMFHCAIVNDIATHPLPPPHPELTQYFEPPEKLVKKAQAAIDACKLVFNAKEVPKRVARAKKDGHVHAHDDDDMLLLDRKRPAGATSYRADVGEAGPSENKDMMAEVPVDDSETEDDDDEEDLLSKKPSAPSSNSNKGPLPTPARSISPAMDPGRAPGRIVGNTYPLKDFQKNTAQVGKAVEDLAAVIAEVVMKPFASRRKQEMLECMVALRDTCLRENEIETWNSFIIGLKKKCISKVGNPEFWKAIQKFGRDLSLISAQEAERQGVESAVTENEAGEVSH
ncbi:hypothetical protein HYPSUDRAFT_1067115 [Hypholoma sublateritium FD-334 SS-4]|uniref:ATP-dependent DNA helicase II subunit 2 n=1 Tax=Hypholoma sublateritium (strain FD-334 SS-4) TaxID=945553 RepID=A0A0D2LEH6_HYPSF|nr:hypothetical protein HYPSUDRAFT_1067115 [Hypholoma sublateritium FD-334 SS-4]